MGGRGSTWLQISVKAPHLMDVRQPLEDGCTPLPHQLLWKQSLAGLHELIQIALLQ